MWDERLSVAASISGRPRACLNSHQAMIWPTASPISCPAPDPSPLDVTPRDSITRYPDDFTQVAARRQQRAADGHRPRADRLWLSVWCDTSRTPDIRHAASTDRASHPIASGTRDGVARTVRVWVGPGAIRWPGVQASSGLDCRRQPPRSAIASQLCHVYALPNWVRSASWSSSPSRPSGGSARKGRGARTPARFNHEETRPPGRWVNARRNTAPAPQSKPVTPASRLVAQTAPLVACGLGLRIVAAGPARLRPYSCCGRLCKPDQKGLLRVRAEGSLTWVSR